jgi:hypothetical protein
MNQIYQFFWKYFSKCQSFNGEIFCFVSFGKKQCLEWSKLFLVLQFYFLKKLLVKLVLEMGNNNLKSVVFENILIEFDSYYGAPNSFGHQQYKFSVRFIDLSTLTCVFNYNYLEKEFGNFSGFTILNDTLYMIFYKNYGFYVQKYDLKKHEFLSNSSHKLLPQTNILKIVGYQEKEKILQLVADEKNNKIYIFSSHGSDLSIHVLFLEFDKLLHLATIKEENENLQFYYVKNQLILASIENSHLNLSIFNFKEKLFLPYARFPLKKYHHSNLPPKFHPGMDRRQNMIFINNSDFTHVYDFQSNRLMTFTIEEGGKFCFGIKDGNLLFFNKIKDGGIILKTMEIVSIPEVKKLDVWCHKNHDLKFKFE